MNTPTRSAGRGKGPARVVFDQVTKRYGTSTVAAVDQVSLDFPAGKLVTLLGPSGRRWREIHWSRSAPSSGTVRTRKRISSTSSPRLA